MGPLTSVIFHLLLSVTLRHFFCQVDVGAWFFEQRELLGTAVSKMYTQEIS